MKKKVINLLVLASVACLLVLNVVVLKDGNAINLKWGVLESVFASGSGSGGGSSTYYVDKSCTITDPNTGLSGNGCESTCDGTSGVVCTSSMDCINGPCS